jgi:DNA-binding SARP family transcriptional activator
MTRLCLTLLGGFQARLDSGTPLALPTRKAQALLAYLAIPCGQVHPRDKLAALLWGGIREESARASLRQALFAVRRTLGQAKGILKQEGDALVLDPEAVDVDAVAFERAVAHGTPEALKQAVGLFRGDFLSGFTVSEEPFEEWLLGERERLRELALEGFAKLLAHQRTTDARGAAIQTALKLLSLDPLQEPVHRTLMRLYAEIGRRGTALRQYQQCVAVFNRQLGVEPEAETKSIYQDILRQRPLRRAVVGAATAGPQVPTVAATSRAPVAEVPLIGRLAELGQLRGAFERAYAGHGGVVAVVGEAGIGKTRLISDLIAAAEERGSRVLLGRCYESEQILPFGPWVDAFRAAHLGNELKGLLPARRAELAHLLPELADRESELLHGIPDLLKVFESVTAAIRELAETRPFLLVLEDVHWADEMSLRILAYLGRRLHSLAVLVAVTVRQEELIDAPMLRRILDELRRERRLLSLALTGLSREDTFALVQTLARSGTDEMQLVRLGEVAWNASAGNPFVVVETVRSGVQGIELADSVRQLVVSRLERLSQRGRLLTTVAAVIGREFEFELLRRASGLTDADAAAAMEEVVRRGVIHGIGERFDFVHDRIREVARADLLAPRRRLIHRSVAKAIEALYADHLEPHILALGLHYLGAEMWLEAMDYLRRAAAQAFTRSAYREAATCLEHVVAAGARLPCSHDMLDRMLDAQLQLRTALWPLAEFERIARCLDEAEHLAAALEDPARQGRVATFMSALRWITGDFRAALLMGRKAQAITASLDDRLIRVWSTFYVGLAHHLLGDYCEAEAAHLENIRSSAGGNEEFGIVLPASQFVLSAAWLVLPLAERGNCAAGLAHGRAAFERAESSGNPYELVTASYALAFLHCLKGEFDPAIPFLERALAICREREFKVWLPQITGYLGHAYAQAGRIDDGLSLLERAMEIFDATRAWPFRTLLTTHRAAACLVAGRPDAALAFGKEALNQARAHGERGHAAWALHLLGEITAATSDPADAVTCFRDAMRLGNELGMAPLVAHCHLGLGRSHARHRRMRSREELFAARKMYRAMGMPYWIKQTDDSSGAGG